MKQTHPQKAKEKEREKNIENSRITNVRQIMKKTKLPQV